MSAASARIGWGRLGGAQAAAAAVAALVCLSFVINVLWFTRFAAIPLPASDAWYFLEVFVAPALDGSLALTDFFVQRSSDDHAQPLQKLILWAHLHLAQLDFTVEALVGAVLAVVTTALLAMLVLRKRPLRAYPMFGVAALFAIALSLNSTGIYTWSLVTLGWALVLVFVLYWLGAGLIRRWQRMAIYGLLASFSMAMMLDELAFPVLLAAIMAVAVRDGLRNPRCFIALAVPGALGVAVARVVLEAISPGASIPAAGAASLGQLLEIARAPEAWNLLVGPLSDSLVHRLHLQEMGPEAAARVQWSLAITLAVAHIGFWWRALVSRRLPAGETTVVAVGLMLLFYATIAGIMLSRVAMFGVEYVHQPRYVLMYQLNVIALLLMFFAPRNEPEDSVAARSPAAIMAVAGALVVIGLQLPLSISAWNTARYLPAYVQRSEQILRQLSLDATMVPAGGCTDILTICDATVGTREKLIELLRENRMNLFSPEFRARHGFDPIRDEALKRSDGKQSVSVCDRALANWAPKAIVRGQS
ncbi:MAG: hypothetical protein M3Q40_00620, partial [Pseudomonadota bacterium]|nr:hypothetical protein [Pseudomonadota bacterium]